jgi:hypothetical protein
MLLLLLRSVQVLREASVAEPLTGSDCSYAADIGAAVASDVLTGCDPVP